LLKLENAALNCVSLQNYLAQRKNHETKSYAEFAAHNAIQRLPETKQKTIHLADETSANQLPRRRTEQAARAGRKVHKIDHAGKKDIQMRAWLSSEEFLADTSS
jgi:hypothetical protein